MLNADQRHLRYTTQTGRRVLTARQRRRLNHKIGHQSELAAVAREGAALVRATWRRAHRERVAGLPSR